LIAAVDSSNDKQIAVYNVDHGMCLATAKGDVSQIKDIVFSSENLIATAGVRHLNFWDVKKRLTS
jgi:WD40 repeat protein